MGATPAAVAVSPRPRRAARSGIRAGLFFALALLALGPAAGPAHAVPTAGPASCPDDDPGGGFFFVCFDDRASGSAASASDFEGGLSILDATVLSEPDLAVLLGFPTAGTWATTGDQGILNNLGAAVTFGFERVIDFFRIDVVGLPGPAGPILPVVVQAFSGGSLVASVVSDPSRIGDSGLHEERLILKRRDGFDRVVLFSTPAPCGGADCEPGPSTSFFADTLKFSVPEPAVALLGATVLAAVAVQRARSGRRAPEVG